MLITMNMMAQFNRQMDDSLYCDWKEKKLEAPFHHDTIPINAGWRYYSRLSDDFNDTTIDTIKWTVRNGSWHNQNGNVGYLDSSNNVCVKDGKLYLSVTENIDDLEFNCSWCSSSHSDSTIVPEFIAGWIESNHPIRYGYIETKCYLPKNHNYWPCFWTTGRDYDSNDDYDEVDVFERTRESNTNFPNIIRQNCYNGADCSHPSFLTQILTLDDSITGKATIFGAEILPEEIVFYINGHVSSHLRFDSSFSLFNTWNTFTCTDIEEMLPMHLILSLTCDPTTTAIPQPHESSWFEYVKCFKLERGSGNIYHPLMFSPSTESTKVYPHVILGGVGHTATISSPTAIWAEHDIILDKGFELSPNTAFSARVISVPTPERSKLYIQNCQQ